MGLLFKVLASLTRSFLPLCLCEVKRQLWNSCTVMCVQINKVVFRRWTKSLCCVAHTTLLISEWLSSKDSAAVTQVLVFKYLTATLHLRNVPNKLASRTTFHILREEARFVCW